MVFTRKMVIFMGYVSFREGTLPETNIDYSPSATAFSFGLFSRGFHSLAGGLFQGVVRWDPLCFVFSPQKIVEAWKPPQK